MNDREKAAKTRQDEIGLVPKQVVLDLLYSKVNCNNHAFLTGIADAIRAIPDAPIDPVIHALCIIEKARSDEIWSNWNGETVERAWNVIKNVAEIPLPVAPKG